MATTEFGGTPLSRLRKNYFSKARVFSVVSLFYAISTLSCLFLKENSYLWLILLVPPMLCAMMSYTYYGWLSFYRYTQTRHKYKNVVWVPKLAPCHALYRINIFLIPAANFLGYTVLFPEILEQQDRTAAILIAGITISVLCIVLNLAVMVTDDLKYNSKNNENNDDDDDYDDDNDGYDDDDDDDDNDDYDDDDDDDDNDDYDDDNDGYDDDNDGYDDDNDGYDDDDDDD